MPKVNDTCFKARKLQGSQTVFTSNLWEFCMSSVMSHFFKAPNNKTEFKNILKCDEKQKLNKKLLNECAGSSKI